MLALENGNCDRYAYGLMQKVFSRANEPEIQFAMAVSRIQSFHSFGWPDGEGKGSFNWGAERGHGPAGTFLYNGIRFKCYPSIEEGLKVFLEELFTREVREAVKLGSIEMACRGRSPEFLKSVLQGYRDVSASTCWDKQLSLKINLWAAALEKLVNGEWVPSIEYIRASSHNDAKITIRNVYPNPLNVKLVEVSPVVGFKALDKEGLILSV